jgi:acylphosphatase
MEQISSKRVVLRVSGKVQGVGFRWFVLSEAERLGLRGWVRNAADGSVELEASGAETAIDELRRRLEKGPPAARVHRIDEHAPTSLELPKGFEIIR